MPCFYFDTNDGAFHNDTEGTTFTDEQDALKEASLSLAEMARDFIPGSVPPSSITMWIRKGQANPIVELTISLSVKRLEQPNWNG